MHFGEYIRGLREGRGMTVNQLAMYSGVSAAQISRIETGKRGVPKPETLKKIADALKAPYEELMAKAGYIENESIVTDFIDNAPNDIKELLSNPDVLSNLDQLLKDVFSLTSELIGLNNAEGMMKVLQKDGIELTEQQKEIANQITAEMIFDKLDLQAKLNMLKLFSFQIEEKKNRDIDTQHTEKSVDAILQDIVDDPDDFLFLDGYLQASEEEKKEIRRSWYLAKKHREAHDIKAAEAPSLFEITKEIEKKNKKQD